jgi:hypothetical protein
MSQVKVHSVSMPPGGTGNDREKVAPLLSRVITTCPLHRGASLPVANAPTTKQGACRQTARGVFPRNMESLVGMRLTTTKLSCRIFADTCSRQDINASVAGSSTSVLPRWQVSVNTTFTRSVTILRVVITSFT